MHAFYTITQVIDKATEKVKAEDPGLHCDVVNSSTLIRAHSTGCKIRIQPHSGQNHRKWVLTLKEHVLGSRFLGWPLAPPQHPGDGCVPSHASHGSKCHLEGACDLQREVKIGIDKPETMAKFFPTDYSCT